MTVPVLQYATAVLAALSPPIVGLSVGSPVTDLAQWVIWRGQGNDPIQLPNDTAAYAAAQTATMAAVMVAPDPALGLTVTCTSNPALNGSYPVDPTTMQKVSLMLVYGQALGGFPAGVTSLVVFDVAGNAHPGFTFPQSVAIAEALCSFAITYEQSVSGLGLGVVPVWPTTSVTIA